MKFKKISIFSLLLCLILSITAFTAFAAPKDEVKNVEDTQTEVSTENTKTTVSDEVTEDVEDNTIEHGTVIVNDEGVLEDVTTDNTKEFYTYMTENGNIYYILIDRARETNNVYVLSASTESDLWDFTVIDDENDSGATITTRTETIIDSEGNEQTIEVITEEEPVDDIYEEELEDIEEAVDEIAEEESEQNKESEETTGLLQEEFFFLVIVALVIIIIIIIVIVLIIHSHNKKKRKNNIEFTETKKESQ